MTDLAEMCEASCKMNGITLKQLINAVSTRWNSVLDMLERAYEMRVVSFYILSTCMHVIDKLTYKCNE